MARRIFISFHYQRDISRVNVVRNHYLTKGTYEEAGYWDHSLWEKTRLRGEGALRRLIDNGLNGTSVTVVLIGARTWDRPWVHYEIKESVSRGNGIIGIYIHNIKNLRGERDEFGFNPLDMHYRRNALGLTQPLSAHYRTYDWVYDRGFHNFSTWVEEAATFAGRPKLFL